MYYPLDKVSHPLSWPNAWLYCDWCVLQSSAFYGKTTLFEKLWPALHYDGGLFFKFHIYIWKTLLFCICESITNRKSRFLSVFFHIMRNNDGKPRFIFWYPFFTFATLFMYEKTIFWGVTRLILQKYYNYNTQKRGNKKSEIFKKLSNTNVISFIYRILRQ